jgi:hypothetical protein
MGGALRANYRYSFSDTWEVKTAVPLPGRAVAAAFNFAGGANLVGGSNRDLPELPMLNDHDRYVNDAWISQLPLAHATSRIEAANIGGAGYCFGGIRGPYLKEVLKWNGLAWATDTDMYTKRVYHSATGYGGAGYIIAGVISVTLPPQTSNERFANSTWSVRRDLPPPGRLQHTAFRLGSFIHVCQGSDWGTAYLSDNDKYNVGADAWSADTDVPLPRRRLAESFTLRRFGYLVGGSADLFFPFGFLADVDRFANATWKSVSSLPTPRGWHATAEVSA